MSMDSITSSRSSSSSSSEENDNYDEPSHELMTKYNDLMSACFLPNASSSASSLGPSTDRPAGPGAQKSEFSPEIKLQTAHDDEDALPGAITRTQAEKLNAKKKRRNERRREERLDEKARTVYEANEEETARPVRESYHCASK